MGLRPEVIRESFNLLKPYADEFISNFYENLFKSYPDAKKLFEDVNMDLQKKQLVGSLAYIVNHLEDSERLVGYLKAMGEKHVDYGVQEEHYSWVGASLLKTFSDAFGDKWADPYKEQWETAIGFIAETMIEGSKNWTPTQHGQVEEKGGSMNSNEETTKTVNVKDEVENHDTIIAFRTEVRRVVREIIEDEFNKELDALKKKMAA
jgi:hemoglobin-like flavoprotein